jgi:hypothetical protein
MKRHGHISVLTVMVDGLHDFGRFVVEGRVQTVGGDHRVRVLTLKFIAEWDAKVVLLCLDCWVLEGSEMLGVHKEREKKRTRKARRT